MSLVYGKSLDLSDDTLLRIRSILGKDSVESMADVRAVIMALDRQRFPTPMLVRFSADDVSFVDVNGISCPVDRHDISVSVPGAAGAYEPHIVACFNKICLPGAVVFDIGANVGFHTLVLSSLAGHAGRVYAFEPNSENCRLILLAAEHNHVSNISLFPVALSDKKGWAYFSSHIGSNGGFVDERFVTLQGNGTVVPTFTLDELSLPNVDVIKADIEGAEYKALKGGESLISRCRPAIVCEFSMEMTERVSGVAPAAFLDWVERLGYRIFILDRVSCKAVGVDSISTLFENWGDPVRIEDLLFLPREKVHLAESI